MEDVLYDWIEFDGNKGTVPRGALIGGIGSHYEPILVCRKFIYGKGNNLHKSMAVLGNFSPKVGKCFYEMQVKADTMKWDVSFTTEKFELLVSKGKWKEPCGKDVEDLKETE
ncbi:uncharacterized protein LOC118438879 [Folsomia candida]|uniref:uncharacterized protein LOC118438879 n=1 Tax=Folsomia candida TaxID=158441 RepID=UPI001604F6CE|nr:uncharacterized protein LOC118438879 [Folsomia candida]